MHVRPNWVNAWDTNWLMTIGRLKSGVTIQEAQADVAHVLQEIGQQNPATDKDRSVTLIPITTTLHGNEFSEVSVLAGAVLAVFLLACANVSGFWLGPGIAPSSENSLQLPHT